MADTMARPLPPPVPSAPRQMAAPPTPKQIQDQLSSPTPLSPPASSSAPDGRSVPLANRNNSFSSSGGPSDSDHEHSTSPHTRSSLLPPPSGALHLSAISETSDMGQSGSDSDSSSVAPQSSSSRAPMGRMPSSRSLGPGVARAIEADRHREGARLEDSVATKSGYLMKKGERRKAWKKRWFVLRGGQLAMYKNDKEYQLLRLIPVAEIHTCGPVELKKHQFTFGIVTPRRTYYVKATSDGELLSWCQSVDQAKEELRQGTTVTSIDTPRASDHYNRPDAGPAQSTSYAPVAIPIPASSAPPSSLRCEPLSPTTTAFSVSPTGGFSLPTGGALASSATSNGTGAGPSPRAPPNSYAAQHAPLASPLELHTVDAGLTKAGSQQQQRANSFSSAFSDSARPGSSVARQPSVDRTTSGLLASSSDDEGDEFEYEPELVARTQAVNFNDLPAPERRPSQGPASPLAPNKGGFGDPDKVILSGYLMKQGKRKNWRKRWFVLFSGRLTYSRSHMDSKVHRQIPLTRILDAIEFEGGDKAEGHHAGQQQHCFKIITPQRTFLLCAPSEEEEVKWLASLAVLIQRKRGDSGLASSGGNTGSQPGRTPSVERRPSQPPLSPSAGSALLASSPLGVGVVVGSPPSLLGHGRQRSLTDSAKFAVREVERRFHPSG